MNKIKRALISVSNKSGIEEFAKALHERGIEILSTGGTSAALLKAGIPVVEVSEYTGSPEILGGRLKTLHPKIHGGLLAKRDDQKHKNEMSENGIQPIDLLVVNLYPFEETIKKDDCTFELAIENIDIGGPTMLRAAAKNHAEVTVIVDPADYDTILKEMTDNNGGVTSETKFRLAKKVFEHTARYDAVISEYLNKVEGIVIPAKAGIQSVLQKGDNAFPRSIPFSFSKISSLRYGENPHQRAAFYKENGEISEPCLINAEQLQGKELSYNNIMDADAVLELVKEFDDTKNVCVIVKHANPCGAAISQSSVLDAYKNAFACDPVSAFGGIIGINKIIDEDCAKAIVETFYEVIAAPEFSDEALKIFEKKKNLRILKIAGLGKPFISSGLNFRKVTGGLLLQDRDLSSENIRDAKVVTNRKPTEEEWQALEFSWKVCKHVKSNAIVYASNDRTLGIGGGQTSRVGSAKIAAEKMLQIKDCHSRGCKRESTLDSPIKSWNDERLATIVVASDAFFPFRDGIDEAAKAGVTAVVEPGGSVKDEEVISAANEHNLAMVFTGVRHFRH